MKWKISSSSYTKSPKLRLKRGIPRRGRDLMHVGEHWCLTVARAIALRSDFTGAQVRALARHSKDASQARRLLALAVIYVGGAHSEAARLRDVTLQIVRDWVLRFNAEGPRSLIVNRRGKGTPLERCRRGWNRE